MAGKMEPEQRGSLTANPTNLEDRIQVRSKTQVIEQLNKYKNILETLFEGQNYVEGETKRVLLQELLAVSYSKVNV